MYPSLFPSAGNTLRLSMLAHVNVPRACPVVDSNDAAAAVSAKEKLWNHLLKNAYVAHCFPPEKVRLYICICVYR